MKAVPAGGKGAQRIPDTLRDDWNSDPSPIFRLNAREYRQFPPVFARVRRSEMP
jgi:hypothetical protein